VHIDLTLKWHKRLWLSCSLGVDWMTQQRSVIADKSFILVMALLRNDLPCACVLRYKAVLFATGTLRRGEVD